MIPNQPGIPVRSLLAAAVLCAFVVPSTGVRAEEPSSGSSHEGLPSVAESSKPSDDAAVPPTTSISYSWIGSRQDSARINIRFSQRVTDFGVNDINVSCTHPTAACAEAVPPDSTSGSRFSVKLRMPQEYDGLVVLHIPHSVVVNSSNEGNTASNVLTIDVDTKGPEVSAAQVNGAEVLLVFDEDLDRSFVPSASDFQVSFLRSATFNVKTVSRVELTLRDVFLTLASPVDSLDAVRVFYDDRGANAIRDPIGNRAPGFDIEAANVTAVARTGVPGVPGDLTATADGPDAIDLDWDAPTDIGGREITGYLIEVSTDGGDSWATLERTRNTDTSYRHTGLSGGVTRHYRVSAINFNGTGDPSNVAHATTDDVLPDAPRSLTATAQGTSAIELSWRAPSFGGSTAVTGYVIEWSRTGTGGWTVLQANTATTATSYTHSGLRPGTTRHYRVAAINRAGRSEWSSTASATTELTRPSAPTGLRVVPSGPGGSSQLLLSWTTPADDGGSAITGYRVEMSATGVGGWIIIRANTGKYGHHLPAHRPPARRHPLLSRGRGQQRGHRDVLDRRSGRDQRRASGAAAERARARDRAAHHSPRLGSAGDRRRGARHRLQHPDDRAQRPQLDHHPAEHGEHGHDLHAHRARPGDPVSVPGRGHQPRGRRPVVVPGGDPHARRLRRRPHRAGGPGGGHGPHRPGVERAPLHRRRLDSRLPRRGVRRRGRDLEHHPPQHERDDHELLRREPQARDHAALPGRGDQPRGGGTVVEHGARDHRRDRAGGAAASQRRGGRHLADHLSWQAPSDDGGARITGYRIEVSADGGRSWEDLVGNTRTTATVYTHSGLAPASTRHYRVSAINRVGVGDASRVAGSTTDATVPDAPTGLVANDVTPTQIDLFWLAPAYNGGAPITGYRIEVSETGATWSDLLTNTESAVTAFSHTGLQPGSTRHYRVSAINRAGTGAASASASAATDDPVQRAGRLNTRVLPHVAAAMTSSTVSAIAGRVDAVARGMGMERRVETNGLSSMAASLSAPGAGGRPRPRPGRPGRPGRPLRRHLLYDALRRLQRAAAVRHRHAVGELGRGRIPPPGRTRRDRRRLEGQHGERPRGRGRARGAGHPGGRRGFVLLGLFRLHRQDRREPGDRHLRHHHGQRASLPGVVLRGARHLAVGLGGVRPGRHRGR